MQAQRLCCHWSAQPATAALSRRLYHLTLCNSNEAAVLQAQLASQSHTNQNSLARNNQTLLFCPVDHVVCYPVLYTACEHATRQYNLSGHMLAVYRLPALNMRQSCAPRAGLHKLQLTSYASVTSLIYLVEVHLHASWMSRCL